MTDLEANLVWHLIVMVPSDETKKEVEGGQEEAEDDWSLIST